MRARSAADGPAATVSQSITTQPSGPTSTLEGWKSKWQTPTPAVGVELVERVEQATSSAAAPHRARSTRPRCAGGAPASGRPLTVVPLHCSCSATKRSARPADLVGLDAVSSLQQRRTVDPVQDHAAPTVDRHGAVGRATGSPASASRSSTVASKADRPFHSGRSSLSTRPAP